MGADGVYNRIIVEIVFISVKWLYCVYNIGILISIKKHISKSVFVTLWKFGDIK